MQKRRYSQSEINDRMRGRIYYEPNDLNFIVKRKTGLLSYTLNFGNPWAWVFTGAIVLLAFGLSAVI